MGHSVMLIGHYDETKSQLIYRDSDDFLTTNVWAEFGNGIPWARTSTRPMEFTVVNPRQKGFEFQFKPKKPGIYLIDGSWSDRTRTINTQPVVLVVTPAVAAKKE